jgi:hypothetical protein
VGCWADSFVDDGTFTVSIAGRWTKLDGWQGKKKNSTGQNYDESDSGYQLSNDTIEWILLWALMPPGFFPRYILPFYSSDG